VNRNDHRYKVFEKMATEKLDTKWKEEKTETLRIESLSARIACRDAWTAAGNPTPNYGFSKG